MLFANERACGHAPYGTFLPVHMRREGEHARACVRERARARVRVEEREREKDREREGKRETD